MKKNPIKSQCYVQGDSNSKQILNYLAYTTETQVYSLQRPFSLDH